MSKGRAYAAGTDVPADRTRMQIEQMVRQRGATAFGYAEEGRQARISFKLENLLLRFDLPLPHPSSFETVRTNTASVRTRTGPQIVAALERATREAWRALHISIKAKLAAVDAGVVAFESEFLAHVVMTDGKTVGDIAVRQIATMLETGEAPKLLAEYTGGRP